MKKIFIGLTGQTGAGKSTVCEMAKELSCRVINADKVAREVMGKNSECLKRLAEFFGSDIILSDGSCNRKLLAKRAFSSRENTDILNSITHPAIIARVREYIDIYSKESDIIIFDAPQLFESGGDKICDKIIAVLAPIEVRLERIMNRDGISKEDALLRINAQYGEDFFKSKSDYIIDGSQTVEQVKNQFKKIILSLSEGSGSEKTGQSRNIYGNSDYNTCGTCVDNQKCQ